jgi:pimeloyl-ACP methyl ester carboxylesterase
MNRIPLLLMLFLPTQLLAGNLPPPQVFAESYALPGEMVRLPDGRALNLRCMGEGSPVVILEAGGNSDSSTWHLVLPKLAPRTRVCAYDRAGYGFSDEGPQPRDLHADVNDLHALIESAGIPVPVLLVGHSLGSNIARKFAQLHPQHTAGMVLVDPPEQGPDTGFPEEWQSQISAMVAQRESLLNACEAASVAGESETLQRCLRAAPAWMSEAAAAAMLRNKSKPSYWRTLRSELTHNVSLFAEPVPTDESYGSIPLVMLRATTQEEDVPDEVRIVMEAKRTQTHDRILAASTRSVAVDVPGASHDIQLDQPDAVVSAVQQLLETMPEMATNPVDD